MRRIYPNFRENTGKIQDLYFNPHRSGWQVPPTWGAAPSSPVFSPGLQILRGQLPQLLSINLAISVEKNAKWQTAAGISQGFGQLGAPQARQSHREGKRTLQQETPHSRRLVNRQCKHLVALTCILTPESLNHWQFLHARWTPCGPEIDQQGAAPELGNGQLATLRPLKSLLPECLDLLRMRRIGPQTPPGQTRSGCGRQRPCGQETSAANEWCFRCAHAVIVRHLT